MAKWKLVGYIDKWKIVDSDNVCVLSRFTATQNEEDIKVWDEAEKLVNSINEFRKLAFGGKVLVEE